MSLCVDNNESSRKMYDPIYPITAGQCVALGSIQLLNLKPFGFRRLLKQKLSKKSSFGGIAERVIGVTNLTYINPSLIKRMLYILL